MKNENDILKWLNREISDEDLVRLKETEDFKKFEKIVHYAAQIETPKVDVEKALLDFKTRKANTSKKGKVVSFNFKKLYKYAAIFIVLLTTSYFLLFNNSTNYETEFAETINFNLPDESEVILNANSEITFNKKEWESNRNLNLDGEAFFKVKKGKKFTVNTSIGNVTVLGTQFNVKERDHYFEVKTYEGLVSVAYKDTLVKLPKGTLFRVVNGVVDTNTTFNISENSWLQKESNFKSTPLKIVLEEIKNQFGYTVKTDNVDVNKLYTGGFSHTDVNIAMQSITIPLQLSYKIEGNIITVYNYEQ
ncbi:FecR domain-containing protein [Polaribacter aestuariivivens]|uniref:FecR domain-containing protein n=1 Tax=Polaribacter aestuariivivens TaxID=2304626 RepID=A0A5S3N5J7_9FLAO|nr:FecR family protein [Polaribacter aestuariivivens]TMM30387.1 FecR domain-containing protein [Polaribacter aestuariivivens]